MKEYKWCAIDAEGDVGNKGLIGVSLYSDSGGSYITDHDSIRTALLQHAELGYTFIAHNAEYDMSVIFWQLNIPMRAVYFNGRFNRGEWRYSTKRPMVQLWDTMALSGGISLQSLGQSMGLEKYPTPQRLLGIEPDKYKWHCTVHDVWECEECYAVRDAEICYRFMSDLTATLNAWGIEPKRRLSGLASHVWRRLDNPTNIALTDKCIRRLAREAYYGGRTETFKLGTVSPCYTADVTSMYPAMMRTTPYPDPQNMVYVTNTRWNNIPSAAEGVVDVTVTAPTCYLPVLPTHESGRCTYPIGRFRGCYTLHELRYAESCGYIVNRVHRAAYSATTLHPFNSFIDVLWTMRQAYINSGDSRALFAKLFMNNLYGYLGMREDMSRTDTYLAAPDIPLKKQPKTSWYTEGRQLFLVNERSQPTRNTWTNVAWAAQTTAAARVTLHRYMLMQGAALLYCDTDSVFSQLPIIGMGEGLGSLRPDGDYQSVLIAAPKLYALESFDGTWRAKAKGVSRASALRYLREGTATFSQPIKPLSQARRRILAGTWVEITKCNRYATARRQPLNPDVILSGDGWTDTIPLVSSADR